eukprot:GEZU01018137.1.p1 GENE.GEZU01018137.1~~GEZU01018137.1.p1  ORF type:complete len:135 (+),score=25.49 GEZU01018137.1:42-446(+)
MLRFARHRFVSCNNTFLIFKAPSTTTTTVSISRRKKMTQVKYNLFAEGGDNYAKYRPNYPDELFETVLAFAEGSSVGDGDSSSGKAGFERKLCADIATGNGQAAISLVNYFDKVIGVEPSASQLEAAIKHGNNK